MNPLNAFGTIEAPLDLSPVVTQETVAPVESLDEIMDAPIISRRVNLGPLTF